MNVEKKCAICGDAFSVPRWRESSAKTCSQKCRGALIAQSYAEKRATVVCKACGNNFSTPQCHAHRRIYCSRKCAASAYEYSGPKAEKHYAWKGGVANHAEGYRYVRVPNHPFGTINTVGYVFEHRVVMEEMMRRAAPNHPFLTQINGQLYLRPKIEVHHINLAKSDNRPRNLLACTQVAHREIHHGKPPMHGEVWPEIEGSLPYEPRLVVCRCLVCGAEFVKKRSELKRGGGKFCSRVCYDKRARVPFAVTLSHA